MGEPIHLTKGKEKITLNSRYEAAVQVGNGWKLAIESADISMPPIPINATDAAKELAADNAIELTTVKGSGKEGKITLSDVQKLVS